MRWIAFLLLLAVLPTVELTEQVAHVVEHALHDEPATHGAHHDDSQGDEHGCTGLVHLCACHHVQITLGGAIVVASSGLVTSPSPSSESPSSLADLTTPEPAQRPPIV